MKLDLVWLSKKDERERERDRNAKKQKNVYDKTRQLLHNIHNKKGWAFHAPVQRNIASPVQLH